MDIVFIETPSFVTKFDSFGSQEDMISLQNELLDKPDKGKVVQASGGARKIRINAKGAGKRGGARVVYYYLDLRGEIWFLDTYLKSKKSDLTPAEKKKIYNFIKETIQ